MSKQNSSQLVGEDSFLDVVANLVGIMIILVAVVSLQAGKLVREAKPTTGPHPLEAELETHRDSLFREVQSATAVRTDLQQLEKLVAQHRATHASLEAARQEMLLQNKIVEREIAKRKEKVDSIENERLEKLAKVHSLETTVNRLRSELTKVAEPTRKIDRKEIVHYPTPIAKTVFADEIHFRLQNGRLSYVPIESLLQKMKSQAESQVNELLSAPEVTSIVGPIDGFTMEYRLAGEKIERAGERGVSVRFLGFVIHPTTETGEEIDVATQDGSSFRSRLARMVPAKTTVSIWVYPESFEAFLHLKNLLRDQGFQVAAWPLEKDALISGGPNGLRTSAQ